MVTIFKNNCAKSVPVYYYIIFRNHAVFLKDCKILSSPVGFLYNQNSAQIEYFQGMDGSGTAFFGVTPIKKPPLLYRNEGFNLIWRRPTLPHSYPCSTIGAVELNCRVRYGNGCFLHAKTTRNFFKFLTIYPDIEAHFRLDVNNKVPRHTDY